MLKYLASRRKGEVECTSFASLVVTIVAIDIFVSDYLYTFYLASWGLLGSFCFNWIHFVSVLPYYTRGYHSFIRLSVRSSLGSMLLLV